MWYLIWGIILIIAGASGSFVLRGTNSSSGLVIVGFIIAGLGAFQVFAGQKKKEKNASDMQQLSSQMQNTSPPLPAPCQINVYRESSMVGAAMNFDLFLNGESVGQLRNGKNLQFFASYQNNIITSPMLNVPFEFTAYPNGVLNLKFSRTPNAYGTHFEIMQ